MHGSRRAFITAGLAAVALAAAAVPDQALATIGVDIQTRPRIFILANATLHMPDGTVHDMGISEMRVSDECDSYELVGLNDGEPIELVQRATMKVGFVDGVFLVPGGEQLRVFYRDSVYAPKHAAMQPDNGAGQVSGDKAQSVGKAGDLKAGRPGGVQSGTPAGKAIDARKQSWIGRQFRRFISPAYA